MAGSAHLPRRWPGLTQPLPGNFALGGLLVGGVEVPPLLAAGEEPEYDYAEGE